MNKTIIRTLTIITVCVLLALSACQKTTSAAQSSPATEVVVQTTEIAPAEATTEAAPPAAPDDGLEAFQLLFGTLKLQGSDQAVTADQAAVLLPLWTSVQTLTASMDPGRSQAQNTDPAAATPEAPQVNTETQDQINGALTQIQAAMTAEQLSAIQAMGITQDSVQALMQELGINVQTPGQNADGTQPQGGGPGGGKGGTPPTDGGTPPDNNGTPPNGGGNAPGRGTRLSTEALTALLQYLTTASAGG